MSHFDLTGKLAVQQAKMLDELILRLVNDRSPVADPRDLHGRLHCVQYAHNNSIGYFLDGHLLVTLQPPKTTDDGKSIKITQEYTTP